MKHLIWCAFALLSQMHTAYGAQSEAIPNVKPPDEHPLNDSSAGTSDPLPLVVVEMPSRIDRMERSEEKAHRRWEAINDSAVVLLTFGLLAVAAIQAWLFIAQLKTMRQSVQEATKAARSAQRQVRVMRRTAQAEYRPIIIGTPRSEMRDIGGQEACWIWTDFQNSGRGTATDVRTYSTFRMVDKGQDVRFLLPDFTTGSESMLGPGQTIGGRREPISLAMAEAVASGDSEIFYFFHVHYLDPVFPNVTHYHQARFVLRWSPQRNIPSWFSQVGFISRGRHQYG